jgi:hypothetical protein
MTENGIRFSRQFVGNVLRVTSPVDIPLIKALSSLAKSFASGIQFLPLTHDPRIPLSQKNRTLSKDNIILSSHPCHRVVEQRQNGSVASMIKGPQRLQGQVVQHLSISSATQTAPRGSAARCLAGAGVDRLCNNVRMRWRLSGRLPPRR